MTKKLLIPIFLLAVVLVASASTSEPDFNGHWRGQFMGQYDIHYEFKVEGTAVSGKNYGMDGTSDIKDGKLDGNKLTFITSAGGEQVTALAVLNGEVLTLSFVVQGYEVVVDLKKADK